MSKLISFGDSFTWGTDLSDCLEFGAEHDVLKIKDPYVLRILKQHKAGPYAEIDHNYNKKISTSCYSRSTWPALLANDMNIEYICYAMAGGSNQTIIRKIMQYLPYINETDYVVVNWTYISRWDFIDPEKLPITNQWETIRPTNNNNSNFEKFYFKYIQNELWDKWESLKSILLVYNLLKNKNIKFMMTSLDTLVLDTTFHTPSYIKNAQNEIKDSIIMFDNKGFNDWCTEHNFKRGEKNHPLEEAHIAAFEYIKDNHDFTK